MTSMKKRAWLLKPMRTLRRERESILKKLEREERRHVDCIEKLNRNYREKVEEETKKHSDAVAPLRRELERIKRQMIDQFVAKEENVEKILQLLDPAPAGGAAPVSALVAKSGTSASLAAESGTAAVAAPADVSFIRSGSAATAVSAGEAYNPQVASSSAAESGTASAAAPADASVIQSGSAAASAPAGESAASMESRKDALRERLGWG